MAETPETAVADPAVSESGKMDSSGPQPAGSDDGAKVPPSSRVLSGRTVALAGALAAATLVGAGIGFAVRQGHVPAFVAALGSGSAGLPAAPAAVPVPPAKPPAPKPVAQKSEERKPAADTVVVEKPEPAKPVSEKAPIEKAAAEKATPEKPAELFRPAAAPQPPVPPVRPPAEPVVAAAVMTPPPKPSEAGVPAKAAPKPAPKPASAPEKAKSPAPRPATPPVRAEPVVARTHSALVLTVGESGVTRVIRALGPAAQDRTWADGSRELRYRFGSGQVIPSPGEPAAAVSLWFDPQGVLKAVRPGDGEVGPANAVENVTVLPAGAR